MIMMIINYDFLLLFKLKKIEDYYNNNSNRIVFVLILYCKNNQFYKCIKSLINNSKDKYIEVYFIIIIVLLSYNFYFAVQ